MLRSPVWTTKGYTGSDDRAAGNGSDPCGDSDQPIRARWTDPSLKIIIAFISDTGLLEFCDIERHHRRSRAHEVKSGRALMVSPTNEDKSQEYVVKLVFNAERCRYISPISPGNPMQRKQQSLDIKLDGEVISSPVA